MNEIVIFSEQDLSTLFPNEIQRMVFKKCMNHLIEIINARTVKTPFVMLECENLK